jgi:hypothetical protein
LISEAREPGGCSNVFTKSDEAFSLLLFDNYIDTWQSPPPVAGEVLVQVSSKDKERRSQSLNSQEHMQEKGRHCIYGGWRHKGMARFNVLYRLV